MLRKLRIYVQMKLPILRCSERTGNFLKHPTCIKGFAQPTLCLVPFAASYAFSFSSFTMVEVKNSGVEHDVPHHKNGSLSKSSTIHSDNVSEVTAQNPGVEKVSSLHDDLKKGEVSEKSEEITANVEEDWESDPENARNWSPLRKWTSMLVVSFYTLLPPLASSMMAPGLPEVAEKYNITNPTITALTLSIFLLSFALAPLVLGPMSEMYGRKWILHTANVFTLAFNFGCAWSPNVGALIAFRFMTGFSGSAPIAIGGGVVSDLFSERDRASAMALFSIGPLLGPAIGPVAGGFIVQAAGVKWVFIVIALTCAAASLVALPLLHETYGPAIQRHRELKRLAADPEAARRVVEVAKLPRKERLMILYTNLTRPIVLLTRSFICFILSAYMAFIYGIYYLMFSTFADFFNNTYGFAPGVGGLVYLGLGIGFISATLFGAKFADQYYKRLADKNGGKGKPEMRIPALFPGAVLVPIGLFWFGWSAQAKIHWIMPIIGSGIFGFALMTTYLPIQLYLIDAFTYAASAVSAASVFRSVLGFAFPLFGQQMFDALGEGGGNSLLAGIGIVLGIPFPIWIYYKGEEMRARNPLTRGKV